MNMYHARFSTVLTTVAPNQGQAITSLKIRANKGLNSWMLYVTLRLIQKRTLDPLDTTLLVREWLGYN